MRVRNLEVLLESLRQYKDTPELHLHEVLCYGTAVVFLECQPSGDFTITVPVPKGTKF